jgi:rubrerythrin
MMYRTTILKGCIEVEHSVASIYSKLMQVFPEKKDFWGSLYDDEREHEAFLSDVKSLRLNDDIQRMEELPPLGSVDKTLRLTDDIKNDISTDKISFKDALALTLKLEESMVEIYTNQLIAKLLPCDDEKPIAKVVADEKSHIKNIKKMMKHV